jgi:hypothetical protein
VSDVDSIGELAQTFLEVVGFMTGLHDTKDSHGWFGQ